jgi:hypothetical protein
MQMFLLSAITIKLGSKLSTIFFVRSLANFLRFVHLSPMQSCRSFYTPVEKLDVLCYGTVRPSGWPSGVIDSFPDFFFFCHLYTYRIETWCILYSQKLLFQFTFRCDWFVLPLELGRISYFFQFSRLFFSPSLQLYDWNLVYCFVVRSYCSSSRFVVIDSFL